MKVQAERFHLSGHIIGFCLQTQKLESHYKTPSSTLAVKGLRSYFYRLYGLVFFVLKPLLGDNEVVKKLQFHP